MLLFLAFAAFKPFVAQGLDLKYTPPCLENVSSLPGSNFTSCAQAPSAESITGYIANIYRFMIGISGILALGMIVAGAIYISVSPGSVDKQGEGRSMITSAIFGIVLIFGSYIILNTINPSLVFLQEPNITPIPTSTTPFTGGAAATSAEACKKEVPPAGWVTNAAAVQQLSDAGITISSSGGCSDRCNGSCTSLLGIPQSVINELKFIAGHCGVGGGPCAVTVTGGTEIGHGSFAPGTPGAHAPGSPVVDLSLSANLGWFLTKTPFSLYNVKMVCTAPADSAYRKNCSTNETTSHLHVEFNPIFDLHGYYSS